MVLAIYPSSALNKYHQVKLHFTPSIIATCEEIHKATAGLGTDEDALVKLIGSKSADERALIAYCYEDKYKESLRSLVKSETSGNFGYLLQLLSMSMPDAEAFVLYHAMAGFGTTDNLLYPILVGRSNEELDVLKKAFFNHYEKDLNVTLADELGGDLKTILMTAVQGVLIKYKADFHTQAKAEADAETLYGAGEGKWGTDTSLFVKTLLAAPPKYLKLVDKAYTEKHGHGLVKAIENEFSGSSSGALKYFVRLALEPWELIADQLHKALEGFTVDGYKASSLLVRYHQYLGRINPVYETKFKISLREHVHSVTSGNYQDLLMHVIDAPLSVGSIA